MVEGGVITSMRGLPRSSNKHSKRVRNGGFAVLGSLRTPTWRQPWLC